MRRVRARPRQPHRFRQTATRRAPITLLSLLPLAFLGSGFGHPAASDPVRVVFETEMGTAFRANHDRSSASCGRH